MASTACFGIFVAATIAGAIMVVSDILGDFVSNVSAMGMDGGLDATLANIDSFKESGNQSEQIGAAMAEDMVWLAYDEVGDD